MQQLELFRRCGIFLFLISLVIDVIDVWFIFYVVPVALFCYLYSFTDTDDQHDLHIAWPHFPGLERALQ
jgi:hypothetical protein